MHELDARRPGGGWHSGRLRKARAHRSPAGSPRSGRFRNQQRAQFGDDIIYSGTVSAAIEGALLGIPAIAVSLVTFKDFDFRAAAEFTATLIGAHRRRGIPAETLLNVNVPPLPKDELKGWQVDPQWANAITAKISSKEIDPRGGKYYWIGGDDLGFADEAGTDCKAVQEGFVSVVRPHPEVDLTDYKLLQNNTLPAFTWP